MIGYALAGLLLGVVLGWVSPLVVPPQYAKYLAVAVVAGLDAVLGGIRA